MNNKLKKHWLSFCWLFLHSRFRLARAEEDNIVVVSWRQSQRSAKKEILALFGVEEGEEDTGSNQSEERNLKGWYLMRNW